MYESKCECCSLKPLCVLFSNLPIYFHLHDYLVIIWCSRVQYWGYVPEDLKHSVNSTIFQFKLQISKYIRNVAIVSVKALSKVLQGGLEGVNLEKVKL